MIDRFPPGGFPSGWYAVRPSSQLAPGQVVTIRQFGEERVLYRTESGRACLVDPICPHLGAHLERGRVEGEELVCGMHGFAFAPDGECSRIAYGTRPPHNARVTHHPVDEVNGLIWLYNSIDGSPPAWKLEPLDWKGWTKPRLKRLEFVGHPQEITENSVDVGHFSSVHLYTPRVEQDLALDGEKLSAAYNIVRPWLGLGFLGLTFTVTFRVFAHGLGYSVVQVHMHGTPIRIRYYVHSTPIEGDRVQLYIGAAIRKLPIPGVNTIVREAVLWALQNEVRQDIPYWEGKRYQQTPLLAKGDGPIAAYRRWCRQFYPLSSKSD